jgi:N-acyl-D-amino-acid deacylase
LNKPLKKGGRMAAVRMSFPGRSSFLAPFAFAVVFAFCCRTGWGQAVDADILLSGATIYDGASAESIVGDIAIKDDKIVAIGQFQHGNIPWKIDCSDLVAAPGFIDLHNHSDSKVIRRSHRNVANYLMQGCTTIVTGNCGSGPIDVEGYFKKIEAAGVGPNVMHLIPQGKLREQVIGNTRRAATADEMKQMLDLADKAMRDGAWGMSTGLIYVPSSYADIDELSAVAGVVAKYGGIYASHIRNENTQLLSSVDEAMTIGRNAGCPVHISHFKSSGRDAWGLVREAARQIQSARDAGQIVTADQYPYIASSTSLGATLLPSWAREGGNRAVNKRLDDPKTGVDLRKTIQSSIEKRDGGKAVRIARFSSQPSWVGRSLAAIADSENKTPLQVAVQVIRAGGAQVVNFSMNEDDVRHIMQIDWVATASDGSAQVPGSDKPHPRNYGTFPRKIGHYALAEKVISEAAAIRSCSSLPAQILGLKDRGTLRSGNFADIVVYDPQTIRDAATFDDPHQYSLGIRHVFVNGEAAVYKGSPTGNRPGRVLRHEAVKQAEVKKTAG